MPSSKNVNLTFGPTDSKYTAPADGYFAIRVKFSGDYPFFNLSNGTSGMESVYDGRGVNEDNYGCIMPAKKGDRVGIYYVNVASCTYFRFVYALGSAPQS